MKEHALVPLLMAFAMPIASSLGLTIWGIRVLKGKTTTLQCFIDKVDGATIEDCTNFSRALGAELDIIEEDNALYSVLSALPSYNLEVSTPGLERSFFRLEQLEGYIGQSVSILLNVPLTLFPKSRKLKGIVQGITSDSILLSVSGVDEKCSCPWSSIERIHLIYFDE